MEQKKLIYKPKKETYGKKIYFGNLGGEEYFIKPVSWDCEWYWGGVYLEGLRTTTEEKQIEFAEQESISDLFDTSNIPSQYLDEEQFRKDMVDSWEERADISERQDRNGEEILLTFGCHTHADSVLLNDCKGDYKIALEKFDKLLFTEEQFNKLVEILKRFYKTKNCSTEDKKYIETMKKTEDILKEFEKFTNEFETLPTEEYWTDVEEY